MLGACVLDRNEQVSGDRKSACHWGLLKGLLNETGGEEGLPERGQVHIDSRERETVEILGRRRASLKNSLCKGPVAEGALGAWLGWQGGGGGRRGRSGVPKSAPGPGGTARSHT